MVRLRKVAIVVLLVGILLTGGYTLFFGGGQGQSLGDTPAQQSTPDTTTPTPTPTPAPPEPTFPTGTSEEGIVSPANLTAAHDGALMSAENYTIESQREFLGLSSGWRFQLNRNTHKTRYNEFGAQTTKRDIWVHSSGAYHRTTLDVEENTEHHYLYTKKRPNRATYRTPTRVTHILTGVNYTFTEESEKNGEELHTFTGEQIRNQSALRSAFGNSVKEVNATVVISESDIIKRVTATATVETSVGTMNNTYSYSASEITTTSVSEPQWVSEAEQQVTRFESSLSQQGVVSVTVSNSNLPSGTTITASDGDQSYEATLSEHVEEGSTIYAYIVNGELEVSHSNPTDVNTTSVPGLRLVFHTEDGWLIGDTVVN
ncbi:hypothetical protein [Salinibaculum rarum]|uniref:hypothetical protein n=1 Tax=Salinibaculum rarum TaxID=3058903 RepID=UPI00265FC078|nr:hypothetical protein [Salinibaculum sp. KK48]